MNFNLSEEQKQHMYCWIEQHNQNQKCKINKQKIKYKKNNIISCSGLCQYSLEIVFSNIADLVYIKCKCGTQEYLGEI